MMYVFLFFLCSLMSSPLKKLRALCFEFFGNCHCHFSLFLFHNHFLPNKDILLIFINYWLLVMLHNHVPLIFKGKFNLLIRFISFVLILWYKLYFLISISFFIDINWFLLQYDNWQLNLRLWVFMMRNLHAISSLLNFLIIFFDKTKNCKKCEISFRIVRNELLSLVKKYFFLSLFKAFCWFVCENFYSRYYFNF